MAPRGPAVARSDWKWPAATLGGSEWPLLVARGDPGWPAVAGSGQCVRDGSKGRRDPADRSSAGTLCKTLRARSC